MDKSFANEIYMDETDESNAYEIETPNTKAKSKYESVKPNTDARSLYESVKPTTEAGSTYESVTPNTDSDDPENAGVIGKSVNVILDNISIKRSTFYIFFAVILIAIVVFGVLGILNLVYVTHVSTFSIPDGDILVPEKTSSGSVSTSLRTKRSNSIAKTGIRNSTTPSILMSEISTSKQENDLPRSKECPTHWLMQGTSCYLFSITKLTWKKAFANCAKLGGFLVEINDAAEDQYLIEKVKQAKETFWIGLTDIEKENYWVWMTNITAITSESYSNWAVGQPDDWRDNEDCVVIAAHLGFRWNDSPCDLQYKYICEK